MAAVDFAQKGQNQRTPNKMLKWRVVNTGCTEEVVLFFLLCGFAGMALSGKPA